MLKEQINTRLPETIVTEIDSRRKHMEETRGGYLALIAQQWYASGCPDVNEYESRLREKKESHKRAS
jgi:hypothetical protein